MRSFPNPRRPRARDAEPLSRERILQAALELTEAEGLAALSTRKLGLALGCEAMSIYHHFPSKHHLLDAMVDAVIGSIAWPEPGLEPIEQLRAIMVAYRVMALRHPAMYPLVATHRLNTPTGVAFIERVLAAVQAVVPDPERAARHFRTLGYFLMGAGLDETSGYARGPSAAEPVSDAYIGEHCPRLAAAARYFRRDQWDATFAVGVDAMLDAVRRDAAMLPQRRR
jgi:AcrR family transcriptional regulator